jgi:hypothetical protein
MQNRNGKLCTINKINVDTSYNIINSGYANSNFDKFTILDSNGEVARIRLFDKKFCLLATKVYKDYYSTGSSFLGGYFSKDSKFISITYVYDCNIGRNFQKSIVRILRSDNLCEIVNYKYDGYTPINTIFFYLNKNLYVALSSVAGKYDCNNLISRPPALLKILEIKFSLSNMELINEIELPEIYKYDILVRRQSVYILITTNRADIINEIIFCNKINKSFIEDDGDEYRVYRFKNNRMKLLYKQNFKLDLYVKFYPFKKILALIKSNNINEMDNTFQLVKFNSEFKIDKYLSDCLIFPPKSEVNFSKCGKWMIVSGILKNNKNYPDVLKNIFLIKIENLIY